MGPCVPGRSGIRAKLISSGQKEKVKHGFEGRPRLCLKMFQLRMSPLLQALFKRCLPAEDKRVFSLRNEAQDTQQGTLPTPAPAPGQPGEGPVPTAPRACTRLGTGCPGARPGHAAAGAARLPAHGA